MATQFRRHAIIDVTVKIFAPEPVRDSLSYRKYQNISPNTLNKLLSGYHWVAMESIETDLEGALHNLNSNLKLAIYKLAPLKNVSPRKNHTPWIGPELRQLMDKRNGTHRRYKRTGCAVLFREFLQLCNEVDERIERDCTSFLHKQLVNALDENKNIWKEMRNLGLLPKQK